MFGVMRIRLTWLVVGIAVALLGILGYSKLTGPGPMTLNGAELRIEVPASWDGRTYENPTGLRVLQAASLPLSPKEDDADTGSGTQRRLEAQDIFLSVWYWPDWPPPGGNGDTTPLSLPPRISRADFGGFEGQIAPSEAQLVGLIDGKLVQVRVAFGTGTPSDGQLVKANAILRTFAIT